MNEQYFKIPVLIENPTPQTVDGKPLYSSVRAMAMLIESSQVKSGGGSINRSVLLIKSPVAPEVSATLLLEGKRYTLGAVRVRRNLSGGIEGYYCLLE